MITRYHAKYYASLLSQQSIGGDIDTIFCPASLRKQWEAELQEKLECQRKVDELTRKKRRLRTELEDKEDKISVKRQEMIEDLERRIIQSSESQVIFIIHWKIK